jgi:hypothetical protein
VVGEAVRRALAVIGIVAGSAFLALVLIGLGHDESSEADADASMHLGGTTCVRARANILAAQAVPSAALVPCISDAADGWNVSTREHDHDGVELVLATDKAAGVEWQLLFHDRCASQPEGQVSGVDASGVPVQLSTETESDDRNLTRTQWFVFDGGCVVSRVSVPGRIDRALLLDDVDQLMVLVPRSLVSRDVETITNGQLRLDP